MLVYALLLLLCLISAAWMWRQEKIASSAAELHRRLSELEGAFPRVRKASEVLELMGPCERCGGVYARRSLWPRISGGAFTLCCYCVAQLPPRQRDEARRAKADARG